MQNIIAPIVKDAFAAATASATLFNTIAAQWSVARDSGFTPKEFKTALVEALVNDGPYSTTHYADGKASANKCVYPKNTINVYLLKIDEAAFRERAPRSDKAAAKGSKPATAKYSAAQLQLACNSIGLTKAQVKALFLAMDKA